VIRYVSSDAPYVMDVRTYLMFISPVTEIREATVYGIMLCGFGDETKHRVGPSVDAGPYVVDISA